MPTQREFNRIGIGIAFLFTVNQAPLSVYEKDARLNKFKTEWLVQQSIRHVDHYLPLH